MLHFHTSENAYLRMFNCRSWRQINPDYTDIFKDNLIDTFYPKSPSEVDEVCFYQFVKDMILSKVSVMNIGGLQSHAYQTNCLILIMRIRKRIITSLLHFYCLCLSGMKMILQKPKENCWAILHSKLHWWFLFAQAPPKFATDTASTE